MTVGDDESALNRGGLVRYVFGDIEVDTAVQEVRAGGTAVHVEPQVFAVLSHLVANRDRVVPKIELLDEIWGSRFVSESALTSRIKSARRACGDNGRDQSVIRTVHGLGYRFVAAVDDTDRTRLASRPAGSRGGLVGRRAETAELEAVLERAAGGRRGAVFVTGPPGVGKSTFLADAAERIDDLGGWQLLRGQAPPPRSAVEPYFPILDALSRAGRGGNDDVIERLDRVAPMWLAQLPSLLDPGRSELLERRLLGANPDRMLREGAELLEELARAAPLAIVLEDLHWSDQPTLDVLDLVLQRTEPCRLIVVASSRDEPGPALDLFRARVGAGHATLIELGGLARDELDQLVVDALDGAQLPDELLGIVRRRSDGIPLFALELVRGWRRLGYLEMTGNQVRLMVSAAELEGLVPESLRQLVDRELAELDGRTTRLLEMAAVVGAEFDAASVAAALGEPVSDVDGELTALARRLHQIEAVGGARWADGTASTRFVFGHEVFRQVLHDRLPVHLAVNAHAAVGRALEAAHAGHTDEIAVRLAEHFVASGDHRRSVEYLLAVGERAARRSAFAAASDAFLDALAHLDHLPPDSERDRGELRVRLALGPALVATRGWYGAEVAENYERALALCSAQPCPEAAFARYGLATVSELRGEYERTQQLLTPLIPGAGEMQMEATELMACSAFHQGKFELSLDMATNVVDGWDGQSTSEVMARLAEHPVSSCYSWASLAAWCLGQTERSLELADHAIAVGEEHLYALSTARVQRAFLHQLRREPDDCRRWAVAARQLGLEQGFPMRAMQADMLLGWVDAVAGDALGAERVRAALDAYRATGTRLAEPYYLGLLAEAELLSGRPEHAAAAAADGIQEMTRGSRTFFAAPELHRIAATALAACGRDDEAREHTSAAVRSARELGSPVLELRALVEGASLATDQGWLRHRLAELLDHVVADEVTADLAAAHRIVVSEH